MDSKIRDYKGEIILQLEKLKEINEQIDLDSNFSSKYAQVNELLQRVNPSLMFYGVYNAGKSSLLNAIFGETKASVADVPETHKITHYKWKNFELVDTPGVNGPEEDFKISKPELKKHDVIMFVIDDSDTFDSDFVAKEIVEIIVEDKPLIIVLNNKQYSEDEMIQAIRNKLYENIEKAGKLKAISSIEQKYQFISVDAASAYKAKKENKKLLLEDSNIQDLEIMITEELKKIDGIKILINPLDLLLSEAKELAEKLKGRLAEGDANYFADMIKDISEHKNNSIDNLNVLIKMEIRKYNDLIYSAAIAGQDIEFLQQELSEKVTSFINNELETFFAECKEGFRELSNKPELKFYLDKINENSEGSSLGEKIKIESRDSESNNAFDTILDTAMVGSIGKALTIAPILPMPIPAPVIIAVIKGIISLFKSKNDNKKRIEELQAQIDENNARQREEINTRINAMQEARTKINIELHKFEEQAIKAANENINEFYTNAVQNLKNLMIEADKNSEKFAVANTEIYNVESKLIELRSELVR
ncbi:MAG: 50S ribosome-binding GTPase [Clostridium sp.]|nr:50S ribosome-binding GTPase [Clostridium sp.]